MKTKNINQLYVITILLAVIAVSCKKGSGNSNSSSSNNPGSGSTTSVLCDGNGSTTYFPLSLNNKWIYNNTYLGKMAYKISGTKTLSNGYSYYILYDTINYQTQTYYRVASNGDIYEWGISAGGSLEAAEHLFIPKSPTVGQYWKDQYLLPDSFVVVSTSASVSTTNCSYTGCLKIQSFSTGVSNSYYYYKEGIGKVKQTNAGGFSDITDLKSVSLQ